jgi:hypothetical protein
MIRLATISRSDLGLAAGAKPGNRALVGGGEHRRRFRIKHLLGADELKDLSHDALSGQPRPLTPLLLSTLARILRRGRSMRRSKLPSTSISRSNSRVPSAQRSGKSDGHCRSPARTACAQAQRAPRGRVARLPIMRGGDFRRTRDCPCRSPGAPVLRLTIRAARGSRRSNQDRSSGLECLRAA